MRDMPEILFRGKRVDNGEWVEGSLLHDPDLEAFDIVGFNYYSGESGLEREEFCCRVDPSAVGRYTGLTDKNGVKIFEGDILKTTVYVYCKAAVVAYSEGCFWVHNPNGGNMPLFKYVDMDSGKADRVEVVGNIHDNPELLEGGGEECRD